jgi:hypothetical protein
MTDDRGLFERADGIAPRVEHGYCTSDNARLLVVVSRESGGGPSRHLGPIALDFVLSAMNPHGHSRNRMGPNGEWADDPTTDDGWGRSVWGLGAAAAQHPDPQVRAKARKGFNLCARNQSRSPRGMAFAAIGAADLLIADRDHALSHRLLIDALAIMDPSARARAVGRAPEPDAVWPWPETRLRYANAALAEAVIAAGYALGRDRDMLRGLQLLRWLLDLESTAGHLSVTPVAGRGPLDSGPGFDQRPLEVAAMADACWRAFEITQEREWLDGIRMCADWFDGVNDIGAIMHDRRGGGFDALHQDRASENRGAESTLAFVSVMQRARSADEVA